MKKIAALFMLFASPALAQQPPPPLDVVSHRSGEEIELQARLMQLGYQVLLGKMQADVSTAQAAAAAKGADAKGADAPLGK